MNTVYNWRGFHTYVHLLEVQIQQYGIMMYHDEVVVRYNDNILAEILYWLVVSNFFIFHSIWDNPSH